jgi:hypothetical protein
MSFYTITWSKGIKSLEIWLDIFLSIFLKKIKGKKTLKRKGKEKNIDLSILCAHLLSMERIIEELFAVQLWIS